MNFIMIFLSILNNVLFAFFLIFKFYFNINLWILSEIPRIFFIITTIGFLIYFITKTFKNKSIILISLFFCNLILLILSFAINWNSLSERLAISIELPKFKTELNEIIDTKKIDKFKNVTIENNLYAFNWNIGVIDNWGAIIYDNSGILDLGLEIIKENTYYFYQEKYQNIKKIFGGDLVFIMKIENNWYLCYFT